MENKVSYALWVLQEPIQYICLIFMASIYAIKIYQPLKKPFPAEKAEFKGDRFTGAVVSLSEIKTDSPIDNQVFDCHGKEYYWGHLTWSVDTGLQDQDRTWNECPLDIILKDSNAYYNFHTSY